MLNCSRLWQKASAHSEPHIDYISIQIYFKHSLLILFYKEIFFFHPEAMISLPFGLFFAAAMTWTSEHVQHRQALCCCNSINFFKGCPHSKGYSNVWPQTTLLNFSLFNRATTALSNKLHSNFPKVTSFF